MPIGRFFLTLLVSQIMAIISSKCKELLHNTFRIIVFVMLLKSTNDTLLSNIEEGNNTHVLICPVTRLWYSVAFDLFRNFSAPVKLVSLWQKAIGFLPLWVKHIQNFLRVFVRVKGKFTTWNIAQVLITNCTSVDYFLFARHPVCQFRQTGCLAFNLINKFWNFYS